MGRDATTDARGAVEAGLMRWLCLTLIQGYRALVSPLLGPACRFEPTCSRYAMEAIDRYGVLRGLAMAAWRLLKCHPFHPGGEDPVR
jgi:uncharacterized protein